MKRFIVLAACALFAACGTKEPKPAASKAAAPATAPDSFQVQFQTSAGAFIVQVNRALAPIGVDRFYKLVTSGYFNDERFFRVVPGFVVQFGMNGDPKLNDRWQKDTIPDEPVKETNARGTIVFANRGPNTRANQLFINLGDNPNLDKMGFAPFGRVISGMNVVDAIYSGYGQMPDQSMIAAEGNKYLERAFPNLDYIKSATLVSGDSAKTP
ncbi:MAG: peptidylprolyl isomerase [Gemmatimonadota bacterium]|nr:peptidylprolyl isomerase [Gemmatimonadota bacterium]